MLIDESQFWGQVRLGEDSELDFKEVRFKGVRVSSPKRSGIADELAALANSLGGRMVFGITDQRQPQPLDPHKLDAVVDFVTELCADSIVAGTGIATLDPELWRRYASSRAGDTDEVALSKLRFVMEDAQGVVRATVGGVLLASRDPREWLAGAFIQAVCYDGGWMDRDRQLDALDITAPLDQQIRDAVRFVARNRRVAARKEPARRDVPQYSDRAVFEAIVNALVHRDYAVSGSKTRLFMAGALLSRQPWQLHERGGLANEPVHAQRAAGVAIGPVSGRRGGGRRQSAVLHRETGRGSRRDRRRDVCAPLAQASLRGRRRPGAEAGPAVSQSAVPDGVSARVAVVHADTGQPLRDVHVLMVYPNKTFREARTDAFGHADFELYAKLPMTVFCAAHGFAAQVVSGWRPGDGAGGHRRRCKCDRRPTAVP